MVVDDGLDGADERRLVLAVAEIETFHSVGPRWAVRFVYSLSSALAWHRHTEENSSENIVSYDKLEQGGLQLALPGYL